jgi:hypothetical protein
MRDQALFLDSNEVGELWEFMKNRREEFRDDDILEGVYTKVSELQWKSGA